MIVYVESNFVLELTFLQEDHESCLTLLGMAEAHAIDLVLPAFSVGEPYEALVRRTKQRRELHGRLRTEIGELSRSAPYQASSRELLELTSILVRSGEEEKRRLDEALGRTLDTADVIPIGASTIRAAIAAQQSRNLAPQDAIVHLAEAPDAPSRVVTKNAKDFVNVDIENELAAHNCRLLTKFSDGVGDIRGQR